MARATSSSATTARIASSAARASLIAASCSSAFARSADDGVVGRLHVAAQRVERAHVGVELRFARRRWPRAAPRRGAASCVELGGQRGRARLELGGRLLEPLHFGGERGGALDQRRVRRRRLRRRGGSAPRSASRASNSRRCASGQPLVGRALLVLEPRDRRARFLLPAIERVALLLGLAALARELLALLREARRLVGRALQLRLVADDRLLLLVMLGVQRGDGARRLRDGRLEAGGLLGEPDERVALGLDPARAAP